jgi:hypothetical protein
MQPVEERPGGADFFSIVPPGDALDSPFVSRRSDAAKQNRYTSNVMQSAQRLC